MFDLTHFDPEVFVDEFIKAFNAKDAPWSKLIEEEVDEFYEAWDICIDLPENSAEHVLVGASANLLKEFCDIIYTVAGLKITNPEAVLPIKLVTLIDRAAALTHDAFGINKISEAFVEVHDSNMSKLGTDGKPIRRVDGKVLKGPNYRPANIVGILLPQSKAIN